MVQTEYFGEGVNFEGIPDTFFLIGLLNKFNNRFQSYEDEIFNEMSWKQCFFLNCITFFSESPTIKQLGELVGCSHQNTKQILSKLARAGYVRLIQDTLDKRKQRVVLTDRTQAFR